VTDPSSRPPRSPTGGNSSSGRNRFPRAGRDAAPGPSPATLNLLRSAHIACAPALPIAGCWDRLIQAVREHQIIIVTGETGSGKSTQLPKICLAAGRGTQGRIACTQPRRIAAVTVSARLAEELGPAGPRLVGYRIRFRDRTGPDTRIQFVTDGLLLAELQRDPRLCRYDTVIVDEAHERSLNIDFLLGVLRRLLQSRPGLKVIITSATIDTERFSAAFGNAPVITVGGRGHPVEILYSPPEEAESENSLAERAAAAVEEIRASDPYGDVLVFLPTERDIRETVKCLKTQCQGEALVLPLYGRMATAEQRRVFAPAPLQKVVIATNVAETSVTVPGIRYVVDSGLARIARYNIRSRTKALPVTPISRASADQRAGRAGRMQAGTCIRLYREEDYLNSPPHTPPEIVRSNLAEVILRLAALHLGTISDFPFVDPPSPRAVKEGFTTLRELGAIDPASRLTKTGRLMARLPLDPRISRMILQARRENALQEVAVIAAALSVLDPMERPQDREAQADQAHAVFRDPSSDFVTYLNIWNVYERELEAGRSRNQMRNFCRERFLSYNRIQEWRDIYDQILSILTEAGGFALNSAPAGYPAIHRSILAGFMGHIALHQDGARYQAPRSRDVFLFPGSSLQKKRPKWIVAAEIVRTSRLFARTAAAIEPQWVEDLAGDLAHATYSEPHWEKRRGEVAAWERVTVFGLPVVERRRVSYGRVNPGEARRIFVEQGLATGDLRGSYAFLAHNTRLIAEARGLEDRTRRRDLTVDPAGLAAFYHAALERIEETCISGSGQTQRKPPGPRTILDEATLTRALRTRQDDSPLRLTWDDLVKNGLQPSELALFPGHLSVSGQVLGLSYRFEPGDEADGITVQIPAASMPQLAPGPFEWLVPGMLYEKVLFLLKSLPKGIRRSLVPIPAAADRILANLSRTDEGLLPSMERTLSRLYGVEVSRDMWPGPQELPPHLLARFEVLGPRGQILDHGRNLALLQERWASTVSHSCEQDHRWIELKRRWETDRIVIESMPDIPGAIPFRPRGLRGEILAYPALVALEAGVGIRLLLDFGEALSRTREGARRLLEETLAKELAYLLKNCLPPGIPRDACLPFGGEQALRRSVQTFLSETLLGSWETIPDREELARRVAFLKKDLYRLALPLIENVGNVVTARHRAHTEIRRCCPSRPGGGGISALGKDLEAEMRRLVPGDFPASTDLQKLVRLPRYLKGLEIRAKRAYADPSRDAAKARRIAPYLDLLARAEAILGDERKEEAREALTDFCTLVEEFRLSVFAPEVGTAATVSPKRLSEAWDRLNTFLRDAPRTHKPF